MNTILPLTIRNIHVERTLSLRHEVLWPDMPVEVVKLPEDEDGWHFGAFIEDPLGKDDLVAVISLFVEPLPIDNVPVHSANGSNGALLDNDPVLVPSEVFAVRFRKFACRTDAQGQGVGTALLKHAMHFARSELKAEVLWCDARVSSADWYSRRGLSQLGPKFYKGPVEYVCMRTLLTEDSHDVRCSTPV
ncbi:hypothetical protein FB446DRAFT_731992 [Lentinula raphanica]|nr:hypothetical protein FB446DRAFT_731992 [Lentinula raphanica]